MNSFTLITRTWRIAIASKSGGSGVSYQHPLKIVKLDGRPKLVLDYVMLSRIAALLTVVGTRFIRRNAE